MYVDIQSLTIGGGMLNVYNPLMQLLWWGNLLGACQANQPSFGSVRLLESCVRSSNGLLRVFSRGCVAWLALIG